MLLENCKFRDNMIRALGKSGEGFQRFQEIRRLLIESSTYQDIDIFKFKILGKCY